MKRKRNFIKVGSIRIPWTKFDDGRTCIDLRSLGLKRRTFTDQAAALAEAERIARERHNSGADAKALTAEDRVILARLLTAAADLKTAPTEIIAAGVAALQRPVCTTIDIVDELLASKKPHDLNKRYRRGLTSDLQAFAKAHPGDITKIETRAIEGFLASFPYGTRRRNSARDNVCHLFTFAKQRNYLPSDKTSAASQVTRIEAAPVAIEFYAAWETEILLAHVRDEFLPWFATNSFSGARLEEIVLARDAAKKKDPIRWQDFDWEEREIVIRPETSKTGITRRIPILDNLFELLRPWHERKASGPICLRHPGDYETRRMVVQANKELDARKDIRRVTWKKNAPRHSYGSYRYAILRNKPQLAGEMGNSIPMIDAHYHNPRPKSEALAYFSLVRALPGNIIQTELFGSAAA